MKKTLLIGLAVAAISAFAAPQKDPVAEGYLDWTGITAKNYLCGRLLTPSDMRHRVLIVVTVDAASFGASTFPNYSSLLSKTALPASHATQWETQELPRKYLLAFSVRNATKDTTPENFRKLFKAPKDAATEEVQLYSSFTVNMVPFYKDLAPVGAAEIATDKMPYVEVYGATGKDPVYKCEKFTSAANKELFAAMKKAEETLPQEWIAPFGIKEPQYMKTVLPLFAKGKPATAMFPILKAGIKSKDAEQAKEAQIMYDALVQFGSDLKLRIALETTTAPARAYYDFQQLIRYFPAEKKKLAQVDAKFKQNKELSSLGKSFEKLMLWGREDFVCKNAGEAKKIVQELQKVKKALETLSSSQNATVQGEAMLFSSQIDALIEIIPTKVPQK